MKRFGNRPSGTTTQASQPQKKARKQTSGGAGNSATVESIPEQQASTGYLDGLQGGEWEKVTQGNELLRRGSKGEGVDHLQGLLNSQGATLAEDANFGRKTDRAVRDAQTGLGVGVDGIVGPVTAGALESAPVSQRVVAQPQRQEVQRAEEGQEARVAAQGGGTSQDQQQQQQPSRGLAPQQGGPRINVRPGQFQQQGLRSEVLANALEVFRNAWAKGDTKKMIYSIIDFSMPSTEKRLFVIDLESGTMLFNELVTHGSGSGGNNTSSLSNRKESNQSSIGLSRTAETYQSTKFGSTALRIDGLEDGYNDNMRDRAVVMHQADYATQGAIDANGGSRLGRSQGCPALDPAIAGEVIDTIKNGCLIYSYYPDPDYMRNSEYQS